jgi:AraC family transcriptional regulator of adaptative response/methylated-DNA-[protein]-cysteine methyltransferase
MLNEHTLWRAVETRDPQWDGLFVYAVPSTRIFCRPTCPSRRPKRDGVRFFAGPAAAAAAGFRACRRCSPASAPSGAPGLDRVRRACSVIAAVPDRGISLAQLAADTGTSPHHLLRTFKKALGITPREFADACRLGVLKTHLRSGNGVAAATYEAGYGSGSRVYERSGAMLGMTPAAYARGADGIAVRYTTVTTPLGRLLVATTTRGVCAVRLGDDDESLRAELRREYPQATLARDDEQLAGAVKTIVASIASGAPDPRLPLDIRATAFQRLVWRELQRIPRGETRTYQEIAARIGRPNATRAVARACATNPVALVVPCHRVVRADGAAGGYRWGLERKARLLDVERTRK